MKWALVILYFVAGPGGGWHEVDKTFYKTEQECVEEMTFFNELPKPGVYMARCKEQ